MTRIQRLVLVGLAITAVVAATVCHHAAYTALALGAIMKDMPKMIAALKSSDRESALKSSDRESAEEKGKAGICAACLHLAGYLGLLLAGILAGFSKAL
jgi:hypothetical protein